MSRVSRHDRPHTGEAGFSLLEVVVALTIVSLAAIGALSALGAELRGARIVRQITAAAALAEARMSALELLPPDRLRALPDSLSHGSFSEPFAPYSWHARTSASHARPDLIDAIVDISWDGGAYSLRTRLHRPPLASSQ